MMDLLRAVNGEECSFMCIGGGELRIEDETWSRCTRQQGGLVAEGQRAEKKKTRTVCSWWASGRDTGGGRTSAPVEARGTQ